MKQPFDDAFNEKYEKALEGLSEEQLSQVAKLNHTKLVEWVNSPSRIRPHLLRKWLDEGAAQYNDAFYPMDELLERRKKELRDDLNRPVTSKDMFGFSLNPLDWFKSRDKK